MTIDEKTVDHLAKLAMLEFNADEKNDIIQDLNKMLDFVNKLNEVDTDGVEPLIHMTPGVNQWREDVPKESIPQAEALKNAPNADGYYFKVPKVIENNG